MFPFLPIVPIAQSKALMGRNARPDVKWTGHNGLTVDTGHEGVIVDSWSICSSL